MKQVQADAFGILVLFAWQLGGQYQMVENLPKERHGAGSSNFLR